MGFPRMQDKRTVLKLAFSKQFYIRRKGFGTPRMSLPFKALEHSASNFMMVRVEGIEPTLPEETRF